VFNLLPCLGQHLGETKVWVGTMQLPFQADVKVPEQKKRSNFYGAKDLSTEQVQKLIVIAEFDCEIWISGTRGEYPQITQMFINNPTYLDIRVTG
jgi:hypothetical protein